MKKVALLTLFVFVLYTCKNEQKNVPQGFDYGQVLNNTYSNSFFNFRFSVNPDWFVLDKQQMSDITNISIDIAAGEDKDFGKILDASQINVAPLFYAFKRSLDSVSFDFNPSIIINAENIKNYPDIISVEQYFKEAKNMMGKSSMNIKFSDTIEQKQINGKEFSYLTMENSSMGIPFNQDYFALIENNFVINIFASYTNEEEKETIYDMLNSINFYNTKGK